MPEIKPKGYAIELFFDSIMEKSILSFRESVYQSGVIPVLGKMEDRPHVSLAVLGDEDPEKLIRVSSDFARRVTRMEVQLEAIGMFPTAANVIYLFPIPTIQLLTTHQVLHHLLEQENVRPNPYYLPDHWVPHCTLEFELTDEQFDLAVQMSKRNFTPIRGCFTSIGVIGFRPIEYLSEIPLLVEEKK